MSLRRFSLFSNSDVNANHDFAESSLPPSYTSSQMAILANAPNVGRTASSYDRNIIMGPWSASLPVESLDSATVFSQTESSVADTLVVEAPDITPPAGTRYIYYRLYTEDESIPSANPIYSNDPSLGRISAHVVTPPHTANSLRRCLMAVENIDASISTSLFVTASTREPLDDKAKVSIVMFPGPGCTPNEPMALVAKVSGADRSALEVKTTKQKPQDRKYLFNRSGLYSRSRSTHKSRHDSVVHLETHYLYYRVYNKDSGAVPLHHSAGSDDPLVGHISINSIPPPHSAASIMRRIKKIEKLGCTGEPQLFCNISSQSPLGEGHLSILTDNRPGSTPENPIGVCCFHTFKIPSTVTCDLFVDGSSNPKWLSVNVGETLRAHDLIPQHPWVGNDGSIAFFDAYKAINKAGIEGFVPTIYVKPY